MTHEQEIERGERARTLLDDPLFNEAFDTLEASIVDALLSLPIEADGQRLRLACMHKAAQQVRGILGQFVAGGDIAKAELLQQAERKSLLERIRERVRNG